LGVSLIFIINNPVITKAIFLILLGVIATTEWQQVKVREKSVKIITYGIAYKGLRFTEEYQFKGIAEWECETGGLKVGEIAFFVLLSSIGRPFHNRNKFFNPNVIDFDYRDNGETSTVHRELNIRVKDMERINSMVQEKVCLNS
jgi:hypothetical protein